MPVILATLVAEQVEGPAGWFDSKGALDDAERARGLFLSCICVPEGDIVVSLLEPPESRFPQWMRKR